MSAREIDGVTQVFDVSAERVTPEELAAVLRSEVSKVAPDATWIFHRVQDGYRDGIPRAVFIMPDDEPCGIPLIRNVAVIMDLSIRLAREVERLTAERDALREKARIVCEQYDPDDPTVLDPAAVYALRAEVNRP